MMFSPKRSNRSREVFGMFAYRTFRHRSRMISPSLFDPKSGVSDLLDDALQRAELQPFAVGVEREPSFVANKRRDVALRNACIVETRGHVLTERVERHPRPIDAAASLEFAILLAEIRDL